MTSAMEIAGIRDLGVFGKRFNFEHYEPRTNYEIRPSQQNITGTQNNRTVLVFPYRIRHSEHQYIST